MRFFFLNGQLPSMAEVHVMNSEIERCGGSGLQHHGHSTHYVVSQANHSPISRGSQMYFFLVIGSADAEFAS